VKRGEIWWADLGAYRPKEFVEENASLVVAHQRSPVGK